MDTNPVSLQILLCERKDDDEENPCLIITSFKNSETKSGSVFSFYKRILGCVESLSFHGHRILKSTVFAYLFAGVAGFQLFESLTVPRRGQGMYY